jgi:hypothetical protein
LNELWPIEAALSTAYRERHNDDQMTRCQVRAQDTIQALASHIADKARRAAFRAQAMSRLSEAPAQNR